MCTVDEVGVVAALPQFHHGIEQIWDVGTSPSSPTAASCSPFGQEGKVLLQNGPVVLLLNVCELNLQPHTSQLTMKQTPIQRGEEHIFNTVLL